MEFLIVLFRWVHVMSAILAIGGAFFMRVILPLGLAQADAESREAVFLRCRRAFKLLIHISITLLLISGAFNTWRNWGDYRLQPGLTHGLWGLHLLLGLGVMGLALVMLGGPIAPRWHKRGAAVNLLLMFLLVAAASSLKFVRDTAVKQPRAVPAQPNLAVR